MFNIANLNKREKLILALTLIAAGLRMIYNLGVMPYLEKVNSLDQEILSLKSKIIKTKTLLGKKTEIGQELQDYAASITEEKGLSNQQQGARILMEMERLAGQSKVRISDIKPLPVKEWEYSKELVIQLKIESGIKELSDFLYRVRGSKEILTIESLQINVKSSDSELLDTLLEIHKILF